MKKSKLITAAAVTASKTAALQLEQDVPTTTYGPPLVGPPTNPDTYEPEELNCVNAKDSYECMDKRVDTVLGALKDDVATHKAECLVTAEELRTEIISDLQ